MMPDRSFWKNRRVFLTGHTGFKGSWMSLWLEALGADVTGYALAPPTEPSLFEQAGVTHSIRSIFADLRDFERLKSAIAESRPEVIIHMAAQTVVSRGYADPIETYSTNVMGTVNLFESLRQLGHPCAVVNVTSDKCYENNEWVWAYRENDRMGGHDPYSNSKGCAELVTSAFRDSYFSPEKFEQHGVAIASARAGNVIGGGDWTANQLIPDLMRAFLADQPCLIRNPLATRPWEFVLEPLRGYLMLDDAKPVQWIADKLVGSWGKTARWALDASAHPHEAHLLKLDASKAKVYLKWHPVLPLAKALEWIVTWYSAYQDQADLGALTRAQIQQYEALAPQ
jgi:CDP-glucose 4,6-dehydratase